MSHALWEERTLVKTWAMRGTLHLLPAAELPRYVAALGRLRPRHHVPSWLRHHGLERAEADAMLAAIPRALAGRELTREELAAAVAEEVGRPALAAKLGGGFGDLLKPAAFTGDLCFAPGDGAARSGSRGRATGSARSPRRTPRRRAARSCAPISPPTARRRGSSSSAGSG